MSNLVDLSLLSNLSDAKSKSLYFCGDVACPKGYHLGMHSRRVNFCYSAYPWWGKQSTHSTCSGNPHYGRLLDATAREAGCTVEVKGKTRTLIIPEGVAERLVSALTWAPRTSSSGTQACSNIALHSQSSGEPSFDDFLFHYLDLPGPTSSADSQENVLPDGVFCQRSHLQSQAHAAFPTLPTRSSSSLLPMSIFGDQAALQTRPLRSWQSCCASNLPPCPGGRPILAFLRSCAARKLEALQPAPVSQGRSLGPIEAASESLLRFLQDEAPGSAALKAATVQRTEDMLVFLEQHPEHSTVTVLEHSVESARQFLDLLHADSNQVLSSGGFILAKSSLLDLAKEDKLATLFAESHNITTFPGLCGVGEDPSWVPAKMGSNGAKSHGQSLDEFAVTALAVELSVARLAAKWGYDDTPHRLTCFTESLFASLPAGFKVRYEPELDVATAVNCQFLGDAETTLMGTVLRESKGRLLRPSWEAMVTGCGPTSRTPLVYQARSDLGWSPWDCSCLVPSALAQSDELLGLCVVKASRRAGQSLRLSPGVDVAAQIVSDLAVHVPFHVEDNCRGSINLLAAGGPKVWYLGPQDLPQRLASEFPEATAQIFTKRFFMDLSPAQLHRYNIKRVVQPAGYMMLTMPGLTFHATFSAGFSIAESCNFYTSAAGTSIPAMLQAYKSLEAQAMQSAGSSARLLGSVMQQAATARCLLRTAVEYNLIEGCNNSDSPIMGAAGEKRNLVSGVELVRQQAGRQRQRGKRT